MQWLDKQFQVSQSLPQAEPLSRSSCEHTVPRTQHRCCSCGTSQQRSSYPSDDSLDTHSSYHTPSSVGWRTAPAHIRPAPSHTNSPLNSPVCHSTKRINSFKNVPILLLVLAFDYYSLLHPANNQLAIFFWKVFSSCAKGCTKVSKRSAYVA